MRACVLVYVRSYRRWCAGGGVVWWVAGYGCGCLPLFLSLALGVLGGVPVVVSYLFLLVPLSAAVLGVCIPLFSFSLGGGVSFFVSYVVHI